MSQMKIFNVTPSARRLTNSLRDIGYDFVSALADLVDNSITAEASEVKIDIVFESGSSYILISDNGSGMTKSELTEALRFGTQKEYALNNLGRYGLGMKTASISQCRRLSVLSRRSQNRRQIVSMSLDLDHIDKTDRWEIIEPQETPGVLAALERLNLSQGTVVVWEDLDRIIPEKHQEDGWGRRRLEQSSEKAIEYLGLVFHRFLETSSAMDNPLVLTVNGSKVLPWNPFAPDEPHREELPIQSFEVITNGIVGEVVMRRYVLPSRNNFSTQDAFEQMSGPKKWNRQQGLYVYRADRIIQFGGWSGIRSIDEHTKLARASIEFQTDLDEVFQINVSKMKASIPAEVRGLIERPIQELCHRADAKYRRDGHRSKRTGLKTSEVAPSPKYINDLGPALVTAAINTGHYKALENIMASLKKSHPEIAKSLGWE